MDEGDEEDDEEPDEDDTNEEEEEGEDDEDKDEEEAGCLSNFSWSRTVSKLRDILRDRRFSRSLSRFFFSSISSSLAFLISGDLFPGREVEVGTESLEPSLPLP